jgi:hypothetical protein
MRYYIRLNGRVSSITVSDTLSQYLVIARGGESDRYGRGKKLAQEWINSLADRPDVPGRDISQWVQARIVDHLVSQELWERLQELKPKITAKLEQQKAREQALQQAAVALRKKEDTP